MMIELTYINDIIDWLYSTFIDMITA